MQNEYKGFEQFKNLDFGSLVDFIASLSGVEYLIITSLLAYLITYSTSSATKQNSLGNFFAQLGQNIVTLTGQDLTAQENNSNNDDSNDEIEKIKQEIEKIKRRFGNNI